MLKNLEGFTLLELLISAFILIIIMGAGFSSLANYYTNYRMVTAQQDLIGLLRKAQALSMSNQFESSYGINISSNNITLFRGTSYASRTQNVDENTDLSTAISNTGISEIVFSQLSGRPSVSGDIVFSDSKFDLTTSINSEGGISW